MSALSRRKVAVQFRNIFENRYSRKRFNDFKNFLNLRLHMNEGSLPTALFKLLTSAGEHSQACAADEFQIGEVKDQVLDSRGQHDCDLALQVGGRRGIQAADE